jgi:hypothetical protein
MLTQPTDYALGLKTMIRALCNLETSPFRALFTSQCFFHSTDYLLESVLSFSLAMVGLSFGTAHVTT